jgi:putative CocE/NonD family hydrolase
MRWLGKQAWARGAKVSMFGISYLGIVQWAAHKAINDARAAGETDIPELACLVPQFAASWVHPCIFQGDSMCLDMMMRWLYLTHHHGGEGQSKPRVRRASLMQHAKLLLIHFNSDQRMAHGKRGKTLRDIHERVIGQREYLIPFKSDPESPFWKARDFGSRPEMIANAPPTHIAAGWHDFFLSGSLADFEALQSHAEDENYTEGTEGTEGTEEGKSRGGEGGARGKRFQRKHFLTVGPWHHLESLSFPAFRVLLRIAIEWIDAHADGSTTRAESAPGLCTRPPVCLFIMDDLSGRFQKSGEWRGFQQWPPPSTMLPFPLGAECDVMGRNQARSLELPGAMLPTPQTPGEYAAARRAKRTSQRRAGHESAPHSSYTYVSRLEREREKERTRNERMKEPSHPRVLLIAMETSRNISILIVPALFCRLHPSTPPPRPAPSFLPSSPTL